MPDIERQAVVDIVVNKDKAEQQYSDFIKKIEEPVKLEIDADVRDAVAAIKELQNMFKALTNQAKDGEKLRINVQGMAKLQQQLAQVDDTLSTLSNHFTGLRRSVDIQAELNDNQRALQSYQNSFKGVVDQINKLKSNRTTDDFFNMKSTKTNIKDILSGASFKQVYEDSQKNASRLLVEIAKAAQETDGLAKTIQLSETQSVSLADIFKAITTSIEASGKSLSDLKIEGLSADIIDVLKNIQKLESEIPTLQAKFDDAVNREKAGSINVQIDAKSIESLSDAISELKGVFKVEDGSTIGFKEEDIDRITSSFSELQTVLENIHNLLSSFDLPKIKVPEVETGEEKPRRESRSSTTVSTTMPTINGGTRTVTNTSDSSTSTGGVSGVEAAVDGQNRLQQELRETAEQVKITKEEISDIGIADSGVSQLTEQELAASSAAKELAQNLGEELGLAKSTVKDLTEYFDELISTILRGESVSFKGIRDILSTDSGLFEGSGLDEYNEAAAIRKYLKGQHIKILPDYKQESGDNWMSDKALVGVGVMRKNLGSDLMTVLSEMNDAIGTTFNLDTSNADGWIQLIDALRGGADDIAGFVDEILKMADINLSGVRNQIEDIVHTINPNAQVRDADEEAFLDFLDFEEQPRNREPFLPIKESAENTTASVKELSDVIESVSLGESPISSGGTNQIKADAENVINLLQQIIALRQRIEQYRSLSGEEKNNYGSALRKTYGTDNIVELLEKQRSLQNDLVNLGKGVNAQTITEKSDGLFDDFTKIVDAASTTKDLLSSNLDSSSLLNVVSEICDAFGINIPEAVEKAKLTIQDGFSNALKESSSGEWKNGLSESEIQSVNKFVETRMAFGESQSKAISNALQIISSLKFDNIENISNFINKADDSVKRLALDITESKHGLGEIYEGKDESATFNPGDNIKNDIKEYRKKIQEEFQSNKTPVSEPETHPEKFEREASAAAEDREEIEKLNNEKRESPEPQSDSAEIEKQGEAYREATADAEKFAEAKRETSGETPSSTAVSESFQREAEAVREAMTIEEQALDELKQKLVGEIPNAVNTKTQAFRSEQVEVGDLIDLEIGKVEELAKVLQSLFKGDSDSGVMSGLKDLFDSINKVKINKDTVQNLTDASWAIDTIGESFKKLSNEGLNSSAFDSLNDLLKKGEELKSLAKILDASEKKIATAGKAAGAGTTGKTTANPTKDATAEYKELLETIQAATKAKTELNKIETKQVNGKTVDAQLADATSKSTGASKAAADAMARIDEMYKGGVISVEQYTAAQKALQDSLKGTAESVDALATAQKNAVQRQLKSDTQTQIEIYRKESEEYKKLYRMQNSGGIGSQDAKRMADLERYMTDQQTEWNAKIAQGAEFIEKMTGGLKTVAQLQADVSQEFSDKWTKGLNNQIETMEKQSSWRKGNWKDIIEELRQEATVFKENIGTRGFKENQKEFDTLIGKMKAAMKSEDFLPIRETWQSSFTAKIETWANQNKIAAKEFGEQLETLKGQIAGVSSQAEATDLENIFSGIQSDAASKNLLGKSLGDRFKDQFKNTMTSLATYYLSFQDFIRYGREAISVVTELDTQLTEMRKVSNESLQTLQQYQLESFDIADRVGTTASQIQSSTADWLRLGKNLPEAANMAEISTKLLNVSEFTDIKDATDALVSATQAYTDITASDIVDKLNLIGNNFAVSTDELAQGLQNAGAVLKTQGNDLDQTLALLTAGNLIGQDMSKASAGIRTIALRISGTEEAKNEIADMGEDVDDFVVRTRSKTDQIIKDYTAVASNMYQGVSVLDPNGNLRDTYDILLDISKIYSEIQAEDKQRGTNRAQALVEQLAKPCQNVQKYT